MSHVIGRGRYARETYPFGSGGTGGGSIAATQYVFVFRPGDPLGNRQNIYTSWTSVYAAMSSVQGSKRLEIDGSFAPVHIPAGAYNLSGVEFFSAQDTVQGFTVIMDDGATITFDSLFNNGVTIQSQSSSPVFTQTAGNAFVFCYNSGTFLSELGAAPFFRVTTTATELYLLLSDQSVLGNGFVAGFPPVVKVEGAATFFSAVTSGSFVQPAAIDPASTGTAIFNLDTSSSLGAQPSFVTIGPLGGPMHLNVVTAFGAKGDNTTDDAPAFARGLTVLAGTGIALFVPTPPIAYLFKHEVLVPSNSMLRAGPGVIINQQMTPSVSLTSCAFACFPTDYGTPGTVQANATIGSTQIELTMPQAPIVGHFMQLQHGDSYITYTILATTSLGGGNYELTFERPIVWSWQAGNVAQEFSAIPHDILMDLSNATFTGTGDRYVETVAAQRCHVINPIATAASGSISDAGFGMDLGGVENIYSGIHATLGANVAAGATIEAQERSSIEHSRVSNGAANSIGFTLDDSYDSGFKGCWTYSIDLGFKTQAVLGGFGCIDAYLRECGAVAGINGVQVTSSDGLTIDEFTGVGQSGSTVLLTSGTNTRISNVSSRNCQFGLNVQVGVTGTFASKLIIVNPTSAGISAAGDLVLDGLIGTVSAGTPIMINATAGRQIYRGLNITYTAGIAVVAIGLDSTYHGIDGANIVMIGTSSSVGIVCQAGVTHLRGVVVTGANVGLQVLSGATVVLDRDCDFTGCTFPIQLLNGGTILAEQEGLISVATTGGLTTLDSKQQLNSVIETTGALTSNATIAIPVMVNNGIAGLNYDLFNNNTGAFTTTFQGPSGGGFAIAQGKRARGYINTSGNLVRVSPDT